MDHRQADRWVTAALALATLQALFLVSVHARPGLLAVVLWLTVPVLNALGAAVLLGIALFRTWRGRDLPAPRELAGYAAIFLVILSLGAGRVYPSSYDDQPSDVAFRLPLDGPVTVAWGGPSRSVNYHAVMPDQRWAYDLLVTRDGRSFQGDGTRLEDYYAYGRPVLAPADGIVRAARDGEPDRPPGSWQFVRTSGNHVVLEVAPSAFLFIAHLQPGSVAVGVGDSVRAGQVLGRVGNSGNSSEPHVHLHLQDTPRPYLGEGIPFLFHDYRVRGVEVERGMPLGGRERRSRTSPGRVTGDIVEHLEQSRPGAGPDAAPAAGRNAGETGS